jgi:hypothetical protein
MVESYLAAYGEVLAAASLDDTGSFPAQVAV